eukprot:maker-scaffold_2-snap-gene-14.32-mRNA-1 protein AED:0.31 eAED:0.31 QI:136/1/1/1/0.5/0.33/3/164/319
MTQNGANPNPTGLKREDFNPAQTHMEAQLADKINRNSKTLRDNSAWRALINECENATVNSLDDLGINASTLNNLQSLNSNASSYLSILNDPSLMNTLRSLPHLFDKSLTLSKDMKGQRNTLPSEWNVQIQENRGMKRNNNHEMAPSREPKLQKQTQAMMFNPANSLSTLHAAAAQVSYIKTEAGAATTADAEAKAGSGVRWNSWSHAEEVFLVAAVLDRFFRRGSLASNGKHPAEKDCWDDIKEYYDRICAAWHKLAENVNQPSLIHRSTSALSRHFKIMKVKATEGDKKRDRSGNFRQYLREWDEKYNRGGRLIPDQY